MAADATPAKPRIGAYGIRLENVERARPLLLEAAPDWPTLRIRRSVGRPALPHDLVGDADASLRLHGGGAIFVDRRSEQARFVVPRRLRTPELVHPLLAPVAAVVAYWHGRESFHAGAFVVDGRAWGIVGERGSGKSTTVAALALAGIPVVSDDLLVVDELRALAGPRSVDLRGPASSHLGVGVPLGVVGARPRWRLELPPVPLETSLAGWVFLDWGDELALKPVPGRDRIVRLLRSRALRVPPRDDDRLLALAALPAFELRRPRRWASLPDVLDLLRALQ